MRRPYTTKYPGSLLAPGILLQREKTIISGSFFRAHFSKVFLAEELDHIFDHLFIAVGQNAGGSQ